jgi:hypothetical protein
MNPTEIPLNELVRPIPVPQNIVRKPPQPDNLNSFKEYDYRRTVYAPGLR